MSLINKVIFTPDESETLGNFILEHEDYIKTLGVSDYELTSKNSLTGTFRFYNWFYFSINNSSNCSIHTNFNFKNTT